MIFPGLFWYVFCWVALAPLFIALMGGPFRGPRVIGENPVLITPLKGFLLGYLAGIIWYAGSCNWIFHVMNSYGGLTPPVAAGVLFLFSLYLGLYHGLFGLLLAFIFVRRGVRRALFAAPFLWVAVELARALITGFPWDPLGAVQVSNIPLTGMATVTGVYGISWVIALVNAGFTAVVVLPEERRRTLLAATVLAAIALQAGAFVQPPPLPTTHEAALLQENLPIAEGGWDRARLEQTLAELSALSSNPPPPLEPGGETVEPLIIWPESPAPFFEVDPRFRQGLSALAVQTHSNIITGVVGMRVEAGQQVRETFNSAILIAPGGDFVARYDKVHLVPWGEYVPFKSVFSFAQSLTHEVGDFSRGTERTVFTLRGRGFNDEKVGVFICYESIFPDEIRLFALNGAQLLVNISNDGWFGETGAPGQHLNMARMRAIENRRWVLRSTNTGITASIDPYGRVVASEPRNIRGSLRARFAFAADTTFYTRHGDWFAWLCAIISLLALLLPGEFALIARPLRVREAVVAGNG